MMIEVKIKDLISEQISGEWGDEPKRGEGVLVIRTTNFQNNGRLNLKSVAKREISEKKIAAKRLKKGDVIIEKSGGSPDQPVGRVVFFNEETETPYLTNNFTTILRPNTEKVHPLYFHYLMMRNYQIKKVLKFQNKTTGIINLKLERYLNSTVSIHKNIDIQKKVSSMLESIEKIRLGRISIVEQFELLSKNLFTQKFLDSPDFHKWKTFKLGNKKVCLKITDGTHHSPPIINRGIPYVTAKHVKENSIDFYSDPWFISKTEHDKIYNRCDPRKDDILYIKDGATTGAAAINKYDFEFSMLSSLALLRVNKNNCLPEYLSFWLNNPNVKRLILRGMAGGAIKRLTLKKINNIDITLPPIELQMDFLQKNKVIEQLISSNQNQLIELIEFQKSLYQNVFTKSSELNHHLSSEEINNTSLTKSNLINDEVFSSFDGIIESDDLEPLTEIKYAQPSSTTEEEIHQLIIDLDNELKFRKEVPCVAEYIKYKIIKEKLKKSFLFDDLWNTLEQTPFVEHPTYDMVRNWIFQEITENKIKQIFDGRGKKLKLQLVE